MLNNQDNSSVVDNCSDEQLIIRANNNVNKKNKIVLIFSIVVILFVAMSLLGYFLFHRVDSTDSTEIIVISKNIDNTILVKIDACKEKETEDEGMNCFFEIMNEFDSISSSGRVNVL